MSGIRVNKQIESRFRACCLVAVLSLAGSVCAFAEQVGEPQNIVIGSGVFEIPVILVLEEQEGRQILIENPGSSIEGSPMG